MTFTAAAHLIAGRSSRKLMCQDLQCKLLPFLSVHTIFFISTSYFLSQNTSKHLSNKGEKGCQQNAMCGSSHDPCCDAEERHGGSSSVSAIQDVCQEWVCDEHSQKQNAAKMIIVFHTGGKYVHGGHTKPQNRTSEDPRWCHTLNVWQNMEVVIQRLISVFLIIHVY